MHRCWLLVSAVFITCFAQAAPPASAVNWKAKVSESLPLLGHRNWILVVDSAYPLQSSPGVETIETNSSQLEVVQYVLSAVDRSIHVRPLVYVDAELPFVSDADAPGATKYRAQIRNVLRSLSVQQMPHEKVIATIDETSRQFHVLVLKTSMTIPYSSVFIRLDCKYWSADAEERMRTRIRESPNAPESSPHQQPGNKPNQ
jgi:RbsD / FucU transport protein family